MAKTKIDLDQLDEFKGVLAVILNDQGLKWDGTINKFVPTDSAPDDLHLRRVFLLMGA